MYITFKWLSNLSFYYIVIASYNDFNLYTAYIRFAV